MSDKVNIKLTKRQAMVVCEILDADLRGIETEDHEVVMAARRRIGVAVNYYDQRNPFRSAPESA